MLYGVARSVDEKVNRAELGQEINRLDQRKVCHRSFFASLDKLHGIFNQDCQNMVSQPYEISRTATMVGITLGSPVSFLLFLSQANREDVEVALTKKADLQVLCERLAVKPQR